MSYEHPDYPSPGPEPGPSAAQPLPPHAAPPSNGIGLAGFIVSVGGLVCTGGFLCPIGLVLSLFGLRKEPRGFAIAGAVIGAVGSILGVLVAILVAAAIATAKQGYREAGESGLLGAQNSTETTIAEASQAIEMDRVEKGRLPETDAGNSLIAPLKDGWGRGLRYEKDGDDFLVRSAGPDGEFDTVDDRTSAR